MATALSAGNPAPTSQDVAPTPLDPPFDLAGKRLWVAGHRGMVGRALVRQLAALDADVLTVERAALDLTRQQDVEDWVAANRPDVVFLAAARVGGILANDRFPADFLRDNLAIETNVIHASWRSGVAKLIFLGSSCIYPRDAAQPMTEAAILSGPLEATNQWYAVAKIAGIKLCQAYRRQHGCDFIAAMPTNLFGPGDNFDLAASHVIPALLRKFDDAARQRAPEVTVWGSGAPLREFLHVDDAAAALVHLARYYSGESHINVGAGKEITIADLARLIAEITGFDGQIIYDRSKPDGTPRKLMDNARLQALGWQPTIGLRAGLADAYQWFLTHKRDARGF